MKSTLLKVLSFKAGLPIAIALGTFFAMSGYPNGSTAEAAVRNYPVKHCGVQHEGERPHAWTTADGQVYNCPGLQLNLCKSNQRHYAHDYWVNAGGKKKHYWCRGR